RRGDLRRRIAALEAQTSDAGEAASILRTAQSHLTDLRAQAAGATRAEELARMLDAARGAEQAEQTRLADLEQVAAEADERAATLGRELEARVREVAAERAALQQRQLQVERWRDRIDSLRRQVGLVDEDVTRLNAGSDERRKQAEDAERAAAAAVDGLPDLRSAAEASRETLGNAEHDAPEAEAAMAGRAGKP